MKKILILNFLIFIFSNTSFSQENQKLKVFYDCASSWKCRQYYDYLRTEIKMVDFVNDRFVCDVHIQITQQETGSNGSKYFFNFMGLKKYSNQNDTLEVVAQGVATDDEVRKDFLKTLNFGLIKYVIKTNQIKFLSLSYDGPKNEDGTAKITKDKWNLWVYNIGGSGNFNGDANYSNRSFFADFQASRVTEEQKIFFWMGANRNTNTFTVNDNNKIKIVNYGFDLFSEYTKAINHHWSYGVDLEGSQNTFQNLKLSVFTAPKIEYSVFPYKDFNAKRVVIGYNIGAQYNSYFDTTLYLKNHEMLARHTFYVNNSFTQKWGNINLGVEWENFLHDFSKNKLGIGGAVEWRIVKGLRVALFGNYEFIRNQINLPKGDASKDQILTRQRQIASNFNYWAGAGIRYQFGSNNNSAVNARFNGLNYSISF